MTQHKDLKRLVRTRMRKTGEAYTAARAQIVAKPAPRSTTRLTATTAAQHELSQAAPSDYATLARISDATLKQKTGCTWQRWVKALDHYGADGMSHREIAELIGARYHTPAWWAGRVAAGYERIKGLRTR